MPLKHLPPSTSAQEVLAVLRADGACIVDDLAAQDTLDRITAELDPYFKQGGPRRADSYIQRTGSLITRSPAARELIVDALVLEVTEGILEKASTYQLNATQVISVLPGGGEQRLHRDDETWDRFPFPVDYDTECHAIWALTDFSIQNGATRVVPGTHRLARGATVDEALAAGRLEQAVMGRGSVVLYTGSVFHGAGTNMTKEVRRGLSVSYCAGWLRQEENQYLATPLEVAKTLDRQLLEVMGYRKGGPTLGYFGDVQDPITAVLGADQGEPVTR